MGVESDEGLRRASIGNDIGLVTQDERVVSVLEDLVAVTEPVQLSAPNQTFHINGKLIERTYVVTIRVLTSWVVSIDEDDLNKWLGMNALESKCELTVKVTVELFTALKGEVEFAPASAVPLIEMVGVCETLVAGRASPVRGTVPE